MIKTISGAYVGLRYVGTSSKKSAVNNAIQVFKPPVGQIERYRFPVNGFSLPRLYPFFESELCKILIYNRLQISSTEMDLCSSEKGQNRETEFSKLSDSELEKLYEYTNSLLDKVNRLRQNNGAKEGEKVACTQKIRDLTLKIEALNKEVKKRGLKLFHRRAPETESTDQSGYSSRNMTVGTMIAFIFASVLFILFIHRRMIIPVVVSSVILIGFSCYLERREEKVHQEACRLIREKNLARRDVDDVLYRLHRKHIINGGRPVIPFVLDEAQKRINAIVDEVFEPVKPKNG